MGNLSFIQAELTHLNTKTVYTAIKVVKRRWGVGYGGCVLDVTGLHISGRLLLLLLLRSSARHEGEEGS